MSTEQPTPEKTPAWLVMWGCLCSDVRTDKADLPKVCPGHGREPVAKPERLDALTQYVGVHECPIGEQCPPPAKAVA
jgi:hypothetical protein